MDTSRYLDAQFKAINVAVWIGVFIVCKAFIETSSFNTNQFKDFISLLIPSLFVSLVRTTRKTQNAIDATLILVLFQIYSLSASKDYFQSLGFAGLSGFIGLGIYHLIDKRLSTNPFRDGHTGLRKYAIGAYLISLVALPAFVSQARSDSAEETAKFGIAHSIGEIASACEFVKHLSRNYCTALRLDDDFKKTCETGAASIAPASVKGEITAYLASPNVRDQMKALIDQADQNIALAKTQAGYSDAALCKGYEDLLNRTYGQAISKLQLSSTHPRAP